MVRAPRVSRACHEAVDAGRGSLSYYQYDIAEVFSTQQVTGIILGEKKQSPSSVFNLSSGCRGAMRRYTNKAGISIFPASEGRVFSCVRPALLTVRTQPRMLLTFLRAAGMHASWVTFDAARLQLLRTPSVNAPAGSSLVRPAGLHMRAAALKLRLADSLGLYA
ncbi:hypothetical protein PsYK624_128380 [Phanerochaete sordida]|uniref:Uncharacterized protein n=1 Tax=Phanerochaete sordida TaxID=48140 RepID=A0A9P3GKL3_9APHY|nr:hypothetical protein PsYK624_128380 [Phanerochaete sordida]